MEFENINRNKINSNITLVKIHYYSAKLSAVLVADQFHHAYYAITIAYIYIHLHTIKLIQYLLNSTCYFHLIEY